MSKATLSKLFATGNRLLPVRLRYWRIERAAVRWSRHLQGHLAETPLRTAEGFTLLVDGESQVGRILYATGHYEQTVVSVLKRLLRPGDTFVDGGAHIGFFSVLASRLVGASGTVLAFEPSARTRLTLERNLSRNSCANARVRPEALGSAPRRAALAQILPGQSGQATLRHTDSFVTVEDVDVIALDSIAAHIGAVHVIKMDLEGFELEALRGMVGIIQRYHPDIVVEVTDEFLKASGDGSALMLYRFLVAFGYAAHVIGENGLQTARSENEWTVLPAQFNALFTCRDPIALQPCA